MILQPLSAAVSEQFLALRRQVSTLQLELRVAARQLKLEQERRHLERAAAYRHGILDGVDARLLRMRQSLGDAAAQHERSPILPALAGASQTDTESGCPGETAGTAERVSPHPGAAGAPVCEARRGNEPGACPRASVATEEDPT